MDNILKGTSQTEHLNFQQPSSEMKKDLLDKKQRSNSDMKASQKSIQKSYSVEVSQNCPSSMLQKSLIEQCFEKLSDSDKSQDFTGSKTKKVGFQTTSNSFEAKIGNISLGDNQELLNLLCGDEKLVLPPNDPFRDGIMSYLGQQKVKKEKTVKDQTQIKNEQLNEQNNGQGTLFNQNNKQKANKNVFDSNEYRKSGKIDLDQIYGFSKADILGNESDSQFKIFETAVNSKKDDDKLRNESKLNSIFGLKDSNSTDQNESKDKNKLFLLQKSSNSLLQPIKDNVADRITSQFRPQNKKNKTLMLSLLKQYQQKNQFSQLKNGKRLRWQLVRLKNEKTNTMRQRENRECNWACFIRPCLKVVQYCAPSSYMYLDLNGNDDNEEVEAAGEGEIIDQLSWLMMQKINKHERAKKNWQKLKIRLVLYLQFSHQINEIQAGNQQIFAKKRKSKDEYMRFKLDQNNKLETGIEENQEIKWYETGNYVLSRDSFYVYMLQCFVIPTFYFQVFAISCHLAFHFALLHDHKAQQLETFCDMVALIEFVMHFFIEQEVKLHDQKQQRTHQRYYNNNLLIAKQFLRAGLVWDLASFLPTLVTQNRVYYLFYFKILRYLQFERTGEYMVNIINAIYSHQYSRAMKLKNIQIVLRMVFRMTLLIHMLACLYIFIALNARSENNWIKNVFPDLYDVHRTDLTSSQAQFEHMIDQLSNKRTNHLVNRLSFSVYVQAFYFMAATITAVGYGDYSAVSSSEQFQLIIFMFCGMLLFSATSQDVNNLRYPQSLQRILTKLNQNITTYMHNITNVVPNQKIADFIYDSSVEYVQQQWRFSTIEAFLKNKFYRTLPPQLQSRLAKKVLDGHFTLFEFFFRDPILKQRADEVFILKLLTSLKSEVFLSGQSIVQAGQHLTEIYFIQKGHVAICDMFERFRIVSLPPGSFFGDLAILINKPSHFNYIAVGKKLTSVQGEQFEYENSDDGEPIQTEASENKKKSYKSPKKKRRNLQEKRFQRETWLLTCYSRTFIKYCQEYPQFHTYLLQRAKLRHALWHKIELEYEQSLAQKLRFMDPLHLVKYKDWKAGLFYSPKLELRRKIAIQTIVSPTAFKLFTNSSYNPLDASNRFIFCQQKYLKPTIFEEKMYSLEDSKFYIPNGWQMTRSLFENQLPLITLQTKMCLDLLEQTVKQWSFAKIYIELFIEATSSEPLTKFQNFQNMESTFRHLTQMKIESRHDLRNNCIYFDTDDEETQKLSREETQNSLKFSKWRQNLNNDSQKVSIARQKSVKLNKSVEASTFDKLQLMFLDKLEAKIREELNQDTPCKHKSDPDEDRQDDFPSLPEKKSPEQKLSGVIEKKLAYISEAMLLQENLKQKETKNLNEVQDQIDQQNDKKLTIQDISKRNSQITESVLDPIELEFVQKMQKADASEFKDLLTDTAKAIKLEYENPFAKKSNIKNQSQTKQKTKTLKQIDQQLINDQKLSKLVSFDEQLENVQQVMLDNDKQQSKTPEKTEIITDSIIEESKQSRVLQQSSQRKAKGKSNQKSQKEQTSKISDFFVNIQIDQPLKQVKNSDVSNSDSSKRQKPINVRPADMRPSSQIQMVENSDQPQSAIDIQPIRKTSDPIVINSSQNLGSTENLQQVQADANVPVLKQDQIDLLARQASQVSSFNDRDCNQNQQEDTQRVFAQQNQSPQMISQHYKDLHEQRLDELFTRTRPTSKPQSGTRQNRNLQDIGRLDQIRSQSMVRQEGSQVAPIIFQNFNAPIVVSPLGPSQVLSPMQKRQMSQMGFSQLNSRPRTPINNSSAKKNSSSLKKGDIFNSFLNR